VQAGPDAVHCHRRCPELESLPRGSRLSAPLCRLLPVLAALPDPRAPGCASPPDGDLGRGSRSYSRDPRAAAPTSPILSLASVMGPLSIIQIFSHAMTVSTVVPALAMMIGLGVGIDYALFIVTSR